MIIGLTGRTGSGKTTASGVFSEQGAGIIDADAVAHEVLRKGGAAYKGVIETFGAGILSESGEIDRSLLGAEVFNNIKKLLKLNELTHSHILAEIKLRIAASTRENTVIDAALLFESGLDEVCDLTVAVTAPESVRMSRIMERDRLSAASAKAFATSLLGMIAQPYTPVVLRNHIHD